jgi:non-specific serine/threonine protein kinase
MPAFTLAISPHGRVYPNPAEGEAQAWMDPLAPVFDRDVGEGLLALALLPAETPFGAHFSFWHAFAARFLADLTKHPEAQVAGAAAFIRSFPAPSEDERLRLLMGAPFCLGQEYLSAATLAHVWGMIGEALAKRLADAGLSFDAWLDKHHSAWGAVGRVYFHLAENKQDPEKPFAFLATYTEKAIEKRPQHLPLGEALQAYSGKNHRAELLRLLKPVERAAQASPWVRALVDSGRIYQPLPFKPEEAHAFLSQIPGIESAGVTVRVPDWWQKQAPPRPRLVITLGKPKKHFGLDELLSFDAGFEVDGVGRVSEKELRDLMKAGSGLVRLKGKWVEVDAARLREALAQFEQAASLAAEGVSFAEGMRLLSGVRGLGIEADGKEGESEQPRVVAGEELRKILEELRAPGEEAIREVETVLRREIKGTLRPYQTAGVKWLWLLSRLRLGGCLADDMGLGKTLQVIALLTLKKCFSKPAHPSLLIAPASLLGNWTAEIEKFAPGIKAQVWHPAFGMAMKGDGLPKRAGLDLVITTYGIAMRSAAMKRETWETLILDEAQAIKNAGSKQTKAVKAIPAAQRLALTGTPVENNLSDLWSIYDFCAPGLLGGLETFKSLVKRLGEGEGADLSPLRRLIQPYLLRRLKTDKRVIADLPDKTEVKAWAALSKPQAVLYRQVVESLAAALEGLEGMGRRGLVLSSLMRLKQICNHPVQFKGHGAWDAKDSGKFARLSDLVREIAGKQEKALVFTQFAEMVEPLAEYLKELWGRPGLTLQGNTPIGERKKRVAAFQEELGPPFFILSIKAGGTGLNLTAANHVIHFDRWWNPAVENQATDRAFRIGQKKNVMVHKFVVRGTLEEKIDALIESKKALAESVLGGGGEVALTEMSNDEILKLVSLDADQLLSTEENTGG